MDIIQGISSLSGILTNGVVVTGFCAATLALFVWRRTRSTHPIMSRIWALFSDKKECDDPEIDRFLKAHSALMQFRFTTGIPAETSEQAHEIIRYTDNNKINLGRLSACGSYFDPTIPGLKDEKYLPKPWHLMLRWFSCMAVGLVTVACLIGCITDNMVVRLKESGTWVVLDASRTKPLFGSTGLYFKQCSTSHTQLSMQTGFTPNEVTLLCAVKPEEAAAYVKAALPEQRFSFGYIFGIFFYISISFCLWFYHGCNARALHTRLKQQKVEEKKPDAQGDPEALPA